MRGFVQGLSFVIVGAWAPSDGWSGPPPEIIREWVAPGGELDRQFGYSVAMWDGVAAIANDRSDDGSVRQGSIHLGPLGRPAGDLQLLQAPDRKWPDRFGSAMVFSDGRLLVGAPHDAEHGWDAGAVWLFEEKSTRWRLADRLRPDRFEPGARFGSSLAFEGTRALVGAPRTDAGTLDGGAVHVFEEALGTWHELTRLVAPDRSDADFFGDAVAMTGDLIAVGAWGDDDRGEKSGSVWLFGRRQDAWVAIAKLVPDDGKARDRFGWQVAIAGSQLLVSACGEDDAMGCIHVYEPEGEGWRLVQELRDPEGMADDWFGFSLAVRGDLLIVGAPSASGTTQWEGRTLIYRRRAGRWSLLGATSSGTGKEQPVQFGWSVATDGTLCMAGRIDDADGPSEAGRAWLIAPNDVGNPSDRLDEPMIREP